MGTSSPVAGPLGSAGSSSVSVGDGPASVSRPGLALASAKNPSAWLLLVGVCRAPERRISWCTYS